jgi:tetratricopeptide (TPR) repeat protein
VLDLLGALVNKSLVQVEEPPNSAPAVEYPAYVDPGIARYRLLETVRQYAWEHLLSAGELTAVRARHLAWCLSLAEQAEPRLRGSEEAAWLTRLEIEHDNLRAALQWSILDDPGAQTEDGGAGAEGAGGSALPADPRWTGGVGAPAAGLAMAGLLLRFWYMHGHLREGRMWLEGALARGSHAPAIVRARALNGAGSLAWRQGDYERARVLYEEALAVRRLLGDARGIVGSLNNLGTVAYAQGDYRRAAALYEESLALARQQGDTSPIASLLNNLALVAQAQGDHDRAATLCEEALTLRRVLGEKQSISNSLSNLATVLRAQGHYERARLLYEESLGLDRQLGDKQGIASSLSNLALVAQAQGTMPGPRHCARKR